MDRKSQVQNDKCAGAPKRGHGGAIPLRRVRAWTPVGAFTLLALSASSLSPAMAQTQNPQPTSTLSAPPPAQFTPPARYTTRPFMRPGPGFMPQRFQHIPVGAASNRHGAGPKRGVTTSRPVNTVPAHAHAAGGGGADETVLQVNAKPIVATAFNQFQTFTEFINLQATQDKDSLTLTFTNADGGPPFQDVRISLNGRQIGSSRNFSGGKFALPVSGVFQTGTNQLTILALGPTGAKLTWKLLESKLQVTAVNPNAFKLDESRITIDGKGFPSAAAAVKVQIGGVSEDISASTPKLITLRTPLRDNTPGGKQDLIVIVGTKKSAPIKVKVKLTPIVLGCDFVATAAGQPVTISGKNFSEVASDNVVTIGGESCSVTSASDTSLVVTVSSSLGSTFPVWDAVVKVTTDGVESKGDDVKVNVGQRVIPNEGTPQY